MADDPSSLEAILARAARLGTGAPPPIPVHPAGAAVPAGGAATLSPDELGALVRKVAEQGRLDNESTGPGREPATLGARVPSPADDRARFVAAAPTRLARAGPTARVAPRPEWPSSRAPALIVGLALAFGTALTAGYWARGWWHTPLAAAVEASAARRADARPARTAGTTAAARPAVPAPPPGPEPAPAPAEADAAAIATVPAPPTSLPAVASTSLGWVKEPSEGRGAALLEALSADLATAASLRLDGIDSDGWRASLQALATQPRVAVVRYEALQAARRAGRGDGFPPLEIVAPLAAETLHFVVRSDSPLRFIHEMRNRRINVGPARGSAALSVESAYRQMFGVQAAASRLGRLDDVGALERLRTSGEMDVVAVSSAGGDAWLSALAAVDAARFRLLVLAPDHPLTRQASRAWLPRTVPAASLGHFPLAGSTTLSTLSFLVSAQPPAPSEARDRSLGAVVEALCRAERHGGAARPHGDQVDPDLDVAVGWPRATVKNASTGRCGEAGTVPAKGVSKPTTS